MYLSNSDLYFKWLICLFVCSFIGFSKNTQWMTVLKALYTIFSWSWLPFLCHNTIHAGWVRELVLELLWDLSWHKANWGLEQWMTFKVRNCVPENWNRFKKSAYRNVEHKFTHNVQGLEINLFSMDIEILLNVFNAYICHIWTSFEQMCAHFEIHPSNYKPHLKYWINWHVRTETSHKRNRILDKSKNLSMTNLSYVTSAAFCSPFIQK